MPTLEELRARVGVQAPTTEAAPSLESLRARVADPAPPIPEPVGIQYTPREQIGEIARPLLTRGMALAEGATLGAAPEITAGATSGLAALGMPGFEGLPTDPSENLAQIESTLGTLPTAERIGYGLAGGLGTGIGLARAVPAAYSTIPRAAGTTALEGAAAGFFSAPEGRRAEGAAVGGTLGGLFGLAIPTVTRGIRNWYETARGGLNAQQRAGIRETLTALERDQITPDEFFARAQRIPGFTMMDMPYARNLQGLARGRVESMPGPGQRMMTRTLMDRSRGQFERIGDTVRRIIGAEDFGRFQEDLVNQRRRAANQLYRQAVGEQPYSVHSPALDELKELDFVKSAVDTVRKNFPNLKNVSENDMRLWDQVYKEMGSKAYSITNPNRGYAYSDVMRRFRDAITDISPEYGAALERFAGDKALEEALEQGRRVFRDDDFITARFIRNLTEGERESYLVGVARGVQDMIERGNRRTDISERLLSRSTMRKLRAALGSTKAAREFTRDVLREARFAETKRNVIGGSPTARITAEQQTQTASMIDPMLQAAQGDVGQATQTGLRRLLQSVGSGQGIQPERQEAIARLLLDQPLVIRTGLVPTPTALRYPGLQQAISGATTAEVGTSGLAGLAALLEAQKSRRQP